MEPDTSTGYPQQQVKKKSRRELGLDANNMLVTQRKLKLNSDVT